MPRTGPDPADSAITMNDWLVYRRQCTSTGVVPRFSLERRFTVAMNAKEASTNQSGIGRVLSVSRRKVYL